MGTTNDYGHNPQIHFPHKYGRNSNSDKFIAKKHCYNKEISDQTEIPLVFMLGVCVYRQRDYSFKSVHLDFIIAYLPS